jgi:hypothetical protein
MVDVTEIVAINENVAAAPKVRARAPNDHPPPN